jgi:hypothetical protein
MSCEWRHSALGGRTAGELVGCIYHASPAAHPAADTATLNHNKDIFTRDGMACFKQKMNVEWKCHRVYNSTAHKVGKQTRIFADSQVSFTLPSKL